MNEQHYFLQINWFYNFIFAAEPIHKFSVPPFLHIFVFNNSKRDVYDLHAGKNAHKMTFSSHGFRFAKSD